MVIDAQGVWLQILIGLPGNGKGQAGYAKCQLLLQVFADL